MPWNTAQRALVTYFILYVTKIYCPWKRTPPFDQMVFKTLSSSLEEPKEELSSETANSWSIQHAPFSQLKLREEKMDLEQIQLIHFKEQ